MREIKFRGWNKQSKIMVDNIRCFAPGDTFNLNDAFDPDMIVLPLQYTGRKDKNGQDVYEGDIAYRLNGFGDKITGEVKYSSKSGGFYLSEFDRDGKGMMFRHIDELEVIGNVYANPELLK